MIENPNEYDDDAYTKAIQTFAFNLASGIDALWDAGMEAEDIVDEINNALGMTDSLDVLRLVVEE